MRTKKQLPPVNMEALHRDYKFLSEFIHVQETTDTAGLLTYECRLLDRLEATIWDSLNEKEKGDFDAHIKGLTELITTALNNLERTAKTAL
jgi:hypothetical protein